MRSRMLLIALTLVGAMYMASTVQAKTTAPAVGLSPAEVFAASTGNTLVAHGNEGNGENSVVCGGVKSHAALVALASGAPDLCGHTDVARIWRTFGITPQVAKTMKSGVICGSGGWTSSGRLHSPQPSLDIRQPGWWKRPLAVWGTGVCYDAWVGTLEDGTQVAVLKGCGNAEMRRGHRPVSPAPSSTVPVRVCKTTDASTGQVFTVNLNGKPFKIPANSCIPVTFRSVGFTVRVTEVPVDGWTVHTPFTFTVRRGLQVDIVNHKIVAPPPITPISPTPTFVCTINGVGQTSVPPGYTIVNGICVQQTVTVSCPSGSTGTPPNCVVQTNQAAQACQGMNGTWTNNGNVSFCVIQQGQCTINVYINGNGNVVNSQTVSCNSTPTPSFACTGLSLSNSGNTVTATVSFNANGGATFQNASYNWGDGTTTTDGTSMSHTYGSAGTNNVTATLTFNTGSTTQTATCSASITISSPATPAPVTLTLSNLTQPQNGPGGIAPDGEGPISVCVTVQGKTSDTIKVAFGATFGSFSPSIVTLTSSGTDRACANYTAPNDSADVGKTETWTVTATDTTANVNSTGPNGTPNPSSAFTFQSPPNNGQHP